MNEPIKPYELIFEQRPNYLYARITADETDVSTAVEYWQAIVDKCRETNTERILIEQLIPIGLGTTQTFTLATKIVAMDITGIKIGFVDPHPENYEHHQFGEMVGSNRGAFGKAFTTVPEAENWLMIGMGGSRPTPRMDNLD